MSEAQAERFSMPIPIVATALFEGLGSVPFILPILKAAPWIAILYLIRLYCQGATNKSERNMHSKVAMVTASQTLKISMIRTNVSTGRDLRNWS